MRRVLVVLVAVTSAWACRSAGPEVAATAPQPATTQARPPAPIPPPSTPPPPLEAEEALPDENHDTAADAAQREALELCQSAREFLEAGDVESALAAVDRAYSRMVSIPANGDDGNLQAKEDIRLLVADLVLKAHRGRQAGPPPATVAWDLGFKVEDNEHVKREVASFLGQEREQFVEGWRRAGRYRPMILAKLEKAGLPSQLSWLPLVESWFKNRALSRASALGMWQFISSTGQRYGLARDVWVDQRMDPEKATDAAIAYLSDLHTLFGDWPKALAGYNCGEARVLRLSRRGQDYVDFWDLYAQLPGETRRYVPRLFAALLVVADPGKYGLELPPPEPSETGLELAAIEKTVLLAKLDGALGLSEGTLAQLNPELRRQATPARQYVLKVPSGHGDRVAAAASSLPEWKAPPVREAATHRVRSGETLSTIARRYGTSVPAIMRANGLRSAHRIWPGQRLRIPSRSTS